MTDTVKGTPAFSWGWLETKNVIKTLLPLVATPLVAYLSSITFDTSTPVGLALGAGVSIVISAIKQWISDNTQKQTTASVI